MISKEMSAIQEAHFLNLPIPMPSPIFRKGIALSTACFAATALACILETQLALQTPIIAVSALLLAAAGVAIVAATAIIEGAIPLVAFVALNAGIGILVSVLKGEMVSLSVVNFFGVAVYTGIFMGKLLREGQTEARALREQRQFINKFEVLAGAVLAIALGALSVHRLLKPQEG